MKDSAELVQTLATGRGVKIISKLTPLEIAGYSKRVADLSICKAIVAAHGGTLEAASAAGGTMFTVRLPASVS